MRLKFLIALIAIIVLSIPVFGQTTAEEWFDKGLALDDQGRYDKAIRAYDKAIELDPTHADAWINKGNALDEQGKYDEAIQAYDKAIEINPQYAEALINKDNLYAFKLLGTTSEDQEWIKAVTYDLDVIKSDFEHICAANKESPYIFSFTAARCYNQLAEDAGKALLKSQAFSVSPELQNAKGDYERGLSSYKTGASRISQASSAASNEMAGEGRAELIKGLDYLKRFGQEPARSCLYSAETRFTGW